MIAPLVSLAASLAPTVFQTILGVNQNQQAQDVAPGARPVYEIPDAAKRSLELQRRAAAGNMPGYDTTRESIEAAGANAVLQGSKFGNPNITQAYRGVTSALKDLGVENAGFRERQMNNLIDSYSNFAGYEEKAFDINQMQPYEYALQQAQMLKNASNQNIYGALGDAAAGIINTMSAYSMGGNGKSADPNANKVSLSTGTGTENGLPLNENFTTQKTISPETYSQLSDMLKQVSATQGGVLPVVSDPTMDAKINMLISNPAMMGELYRIIQNLNIKTR